MPKFLKLQITDKYDIKLNLEEIKLVERYVNENGVKATRVTMKDGSYKIYTLNPDSIFDAFPEE